MKKLQEFVSESLNVSQLMDAKEMSETSGAAAVTCTAGECTYGLCTLSLMTL